MIRAQPPSEEQEEAGDLKDLVASLDLPTVKSRKDRGALTPTVASLATLLPAEHLAAWEALTPIANAAHQGVTAITWPRLVDATMASPNCQNLIKLIRTGLPGLARRADALLPLQTPPHED